MKNQWHGKSKGTVLGYKIFVFFLKKLGISAAYSLLFFVCVYYVIFSPASTKAIYRYFHLRLKYTKLKSAFSVYRSYYIFGQTIIDKVAITSGLRSKFTFEFEGIEYLNEALKNQKGGILISGHIGNFEIAEYFFSELKEPTKIHLLTAAAEKTEIKTYVESITKKTNINMILHSEDMSHIFEIHSALSQNEIICITGDRFMNQTRIENHSFLGAHAPFASGPFIFASKLNAPVYFVYVMKESRFHYHLYTLPSKSKKRDYKSLLEEYTSSLELMLKKYPLQWFNYYEFWQTDKNESSNL